MVHPQKAEARRLAGILVLIGGILLIVFGLLGVIGAGFSTGRYGLEIGGGGILTLVLGIVALVLHRSLGSLVVQVVLIIVGLLAGGLGGDLVALGAIIALIVGLV